MDDSSAATMVAVDPRHVSYTQLMYALHATSLVIAVLTGASVAGKFVFGWPSIIAVILNYARRSAVRETWLESHFRWQLRTFWTAAVAVICFAPLVFTFVLIPLVIAVYVVVGVWAIYRIARGWIALRDGLPVPF